MSRPGPVESGQLGRQGLIGLAVVERQMVPNRSVESRVQLYGVNRRRAHGSQISQKSPFGGEEICPSGAAPPCFSHSSNHRVFCRVFPVRLLQWER